MGQLQFIFFVFCPGVGTLIRGEGDRIEENKFFLNELPGINSVVPKNGLANAVQVSIMVNMWSDMRVLHTV